MIAWECGDFAAKINKSGFASRIFTISVGPQEVPLAVHEADLSQSPVFEKMCNGDFEENQTQLVKLPEDDPIVMKIILHQWFEMIEVLQDLYTTAEKYDLQDLKVVVIEKLLASIDVQTQACSFLTMAQKIYAAVPDTDTRYRGFFRGLAYDLLAFAGGQDKMATDVRSCFDECIYGGGAMAIDLAEVLYTFYDSNITPAESRKRLSRVD
ncbi:MAG: hypothetical protein Q9183_006853 [Haloplaca sp. 2 TL-2023]